MGLLKRLGALDSKEQMSITNITVFIFVLITSFKTLFSGVTLEFMHLHWHIEGLDLAATLPLLFSLMNYSNKKMQQTKVLLADKQSSPTQP